MQKTDKSFKITLPTIYDVEIETKDKRKKAVTIQFTDAPDNAGDLVEAEVFDMNKQLPLESARALIKSAVITEGFDAAELDGFAALALASRIRFCVMERTNSIMVGVTGETAADPKE